MQLVVTTDTTTLSYWLNWRVVLCGTWLLTCMIMASYVIWKYEGPGHSNSNKGGVPQDVARIVHVDETWRPCIKQIHPFWLLAFRVVAFCLLLATLVVKVNMNGFLIYYYYTQWTFTLVTIYFGFGSLLSVYGCYQHHKYGHNLHPLAIDAEQGSYLPLPSGKTTNVVSNEKMLVLPNEFDALHMASMLGYLFQIFFQMNAGAVMLTDSLYWIVIFPFLSIKEYNLSFMTVNMHTLNAILLIGDTALNRLRFPWFRISYFVLWTAIFVIFQWIIHVCVVIWWPYPFLDLSSPSAPLWYFLVALMHIPCYGFFVLLVESKYYLLSKWFPQSYQ